MGIYFADHAPRNGGRTLEQWRSRLDIMKKLFALLLFVSTVALGQTYPSPTYNALTVQSAFNATGLVTLADHATQAANTIIGNATGSPASPTAVTVTGCNGAAQALQWTNGSGFGCNSAIIASNVSGIVAPANGGTGTTTGLTPYAPTLATIAALNAATSATLPQSQVIIAGFSTAGDAGAGLFNIGATTTANGCTIFNDASGRSWYRQTTGNVTNVRWCGAKGDGSTNDTTAFVNAVAVGKSIFVPDGNYQVLDNNIVLTAGQALEGPSFATFAPGAFTGAGVIINCTNNTGHACIAVTANVTWITIANVTITRSVSPVGTAAVGSNGIQFNGSTQYANIHDVYVYNQYIGLVLHDTTTSYLTNVTVTNNGFDGVSVTNVSVGPLQWVMSNVLSEDNGHDGFIIQSFNVGGATSISLSNMDKIFTFGNTNVGFAIVGTVGQPLFGPRLTNCFLGGDGNDEILFTGQGGDVQISDCFFELSGTGLTGPLGTTAASGLGSGIEIDNGSTIKLTNNIINGESADGILLAGGTAITVSNNTITNVGQNASSSATGLFISAGVTADVTGNTITNVSGSTTQKFGINNGGTINVLSGNNLTGNITNNYTGNAATDSCNAGATCTFNQPSVNQPNIVGVTTNSNAATGSVGEFLTNQTGPTAFTSGTTAAATSLTLSAGDWDVECLVSLAPAGTTVVSGVILGVSNSGTAFGALGSFIQMNATAAQGAAQTFASPVVRVSLAASTTYFCPANIGFTVSTLNATGFIRARRVR
jgi:parallel beta-helix repeat protein